jgi:putative hydrolase of the HAD superfamily
LQRAGHELLYLSDNVPERVNYLESRYHFLQFFNNGIFSYQAKLRKPDPRLYQLLLRKASRPAQPPVYIDDVEEFLEPARQLGIVTIHFKGPRRLGQELRLLGLL